MTHRFPPAAAGPCGPGRHQPAPRGLALPRRTAWPRGVLAMLAALVLPAAAGPAGPASGAAASPQAGGTHAAPGNAASLPPRPDPERGRRLLSQYHCGLCHVIPGVMAARGAVAQSLQGFGRRSYIAGQLPNRPDLLARWIADPRALVPDTLMPDMVASEADARDMAAYLGTVR
jgi:cytochrome c